MKIHRKAEPQIDAVNLRLSVRLRQRLDDAVARRQASAGAGIRVTLGALCRDLLERGLDEIERDDRR